MLEAGPIHAFLSGSGCDGRGRPVAMVLAFHDRCIETQHDFIQWLFPLTEPSAAVPDAPVLTPAEVAAIRACPAARASLAAARRRMANFYSDNDHWLAAHDHNHRRISRIIASLALLAGPAEARGFLDHIEARAAGSRVNAESRRYWRAALQAGSAPPKR